MSQYVENLRRELAVAADAGGGGDDVRPLAERPTAPLESAVRLMLLDEMSARGRMRCQPADEITRELAPVSVELPLRAGEPDFVVMPAPVDAPDEPAPDPPPPLAPPEADEGPTARIKLRLPEQLKAGVEQAASHERLSVNPWLIRVAAPRSRMAKRPVFEPHLAGGHSHSEVRYARTDLGHDRRRTPPRHRGRRAPQRLVQRGRPQGRPANPRRVREKNTDSPVKAPKFRILSPTSPGASIHVT